MITDLKMLQAPVRFRVVRTMVQIWAELMDRGLLPHLKNGLANDASTTDGSPMCQTYIISREDISTTHISGQADVPSIGKTSLPAEASLVTKDYYEWKNGLAIIINNETFLTEYEKREGTNCDERTLTQAFEKYNFTISVVKDGTVKEIMDTLSTIRDETIYDCVVIAVLTHGSYGDKLQAYDGEYHKERLWQMLNGSQCPHLTGKPKVVIIQACRGNQASAASQKIQTDSTPIRQNEITLPVEADILTSYSTYEGRYSFRDIEKGTWYIQSLSSEIFKHGDTQDFVTLLTQVNKTVAEKENKDKFVGAIQKQMPVIQSTLTKAFYLGGTKPGLEQQSMISILRDQSEKLDELLQLAGSKTASASTLTLKKPGARWNCLKMPPPAMKNNFPYDSGSILKMAILLQSFLKDKEVVPQLKSDVAAYGALLVRHVYYWECMDESERLPTYNSLVQFITTHCKIWQQYKKFDYFHLEDRNTTDTKRTSGARTQQASTNSTINKLPLKTRVLKHKT